jgi:hypothetical protein
LDTTNLFLQTSYPSFTSCFLQEIFLFNIHIRHITCLIEYCHQFFLFSLKKKPNLVSEAVTVSKQLVLTLRSRL